MFHKYNLFHLKRWLVGYGTATTVLLYIIPIHIYLTDLSMAAKRWVSKHSTKVKNKQWVLWGEESKTTSQQMMATLFSFLCSAEQWFLFGSNKVYIVSTTLKVKIMPSNSKLLYLCIFLQNITLADNRPYKFGLLVLPAPFTHQQLLMRRNKCIQLNVNYFFIGERTLCLLC